jgi:FAD/FMN-containing dehydrogenase/Fe-S oxidoreductase
VKRIDEAIQEFVEALRPEFAGEIRTDTFSRILYSTDASLYQIEPLAVLLPRTRGDVAASVTLAAHHRLPLLPRGSGTSLAGQTVGAAIVLDFSKYMHRILETDLEERRARVEPGVILDQLNAHLLPFGLRFGPDVATSNRATIGGMIGNNSSGSHSILYGITLDHVGAMRVLMSSGEELFFEDLGAAAWDARSGLQSHEGQIYRSVRRLVQENREEILARYPKIMRKVGGYNLDSVMGEAGGNLCRLMVGSEGTLGVCTEAVLTLEPEPRAKGLDIVHFSDLISAMEALHAILELQPAAVELIDRMLLDLTRLQPAFARKMNFVEGNPDAILVVEFFGENSAEVTAKLDRLETRLRADHVGTGFVRAIRPEDQANVWAIRKAGLGLLSSMRGDAKPISFVEDTAVDPRHLSEYVRRFQQILQAHNARASFYGHASVGCLHVKPIINVKEAAGIRQMVEISAAVKDLVVEFGGAMSAEHGDGIVRSHYNRELFGDRLYAAFHDLKAAFDPAGMMNPGKIIDSPPMTAHLRRGPDNGPPESSTHLDFEREGGWERAIEQCNGMGVCRKLDSGTMCPSFMATREEEHSTRGRANALRAMLTGAIPPDTNPEAKVMEALDLCLSCKACKTECPTNVDMAKLKFEFLAGYLKRHGTPMRSLVFGNIAALSRLGSATAPLSNWVMRAPWVRRTVQQWMGIHPDRHAPPFVRRTFRGWLRHNPPKDRPAGTPKVVLFNDTFINYNEPWVGIAALKVLESTGAQVLIPEVVCCGRPMISKGLLHEAKENARQNVARLVPFVAAGAHIVGCEPSCILTLRDEYPDLLQTQQAHQVAEKVLSLEEYLCCRLEDGSWQPQFADVPRQVLLHGHCHQKSLVGSGPSLRLLRMAPGFKAEEVDSGCCGMAGAFGYEREHYEISMQIGEMRLFPAIRQAPPEAWIVASGTSCRQQILHATGRKAIHLAEALAGVLGPEFQDSRHGNTTRPDAWR